MVVTARFTVPGILTSTQTSGAPPLPDTTGLIFAWSLNGLTALYQNDEFLLSASGDSSSANIPSTANAPYPLTWATVGTLGTNPVNVTWNDQSGNAHNQDGTAHAPSLDDVNYQVTFNGTSQYMATSAIDLSAVNKLTLHYWFKVPDVSLICPLAMFGDVLPLQSKTFGIWLENYNILAAEAGTATYNMKQYTTLTNNTYVLVSLVIDNTLTGSAQTTAYVNGSSAGWTSSATDTISDAFDSKPVYLGYSPDNPNYGAHSSKHCLLFNYAQTGAEVLAWYDYLAYIS